MSKTAHLYSFFPGMTGLFRRPLASNCGLPPSGDAGTAPDSDEVKRAAVLRHVICRSLIRPLAAACAAELVVITRNSRQRRFIINSSVVVHVHYMLVDAEIHQDVTTTSSRDETGRRTACCCHATSTIVTASHSVNVAPHSQ